jgi:hypothetical protein
MSKAVASKGALGSFYEGPRPTKRFLTCEKEFSMKHLFTDEQIRTILTHHLLLIPLKKLEEWFGHLQETTFMLILFGPASGQQSVEIELTIDISDALQIIRRMKSRPFGSRKERRIPVQYRKLVTRYFPDGTFALISVAAGEASMAPLRIRTAWMDRHQ